MPNPQCSYCYSHIEARPGCKGRVTKPSAKSSEIKPVTVWAKDVHALCEAPLDAITQAVSKSALHLQQQQQQGLNLSEGCTHPCELVAGGAAVHATFRDLFFVSHTGAWAAESPALVPLEPVPDHQSQH